MRRNRAAWAAALVLVLYTALVIYSTLHHEPWRDEAQAWLIVRDLPVPAVLQQMVYEGTPALWHMLLLPFAKLGAPYAAEAAVHLLLAIAAVALLIRRGPFPLWFKALFVFSYYMSYEYAVVARNYNLTVLLLFALAAVHEKRFERPVVYGLLAALLANANGHSLAMAAGIALLFVAESWRRRRFLRDEITAVAVMAAGGGAALLQMSSISRNQLVGDRLHRDLLAPLVATKNAFLPGFPNAAAAVALPAAALVAWLLWRRSRAALWLLACGLSGLFAIFLLKHSGGLRHHGLVLVFVIFALWIAWGGRRAVPRQRLDRWVLGTFGALLLAAAPFTFSAHRSDAVGQYSGSRAMATYLLDHGLQGRALVAHESAPTSSVLPFLPGLRPWYADVQESGTFVTWNREYADNRAIAPEEAALRAVRAPGWKPGALLLLNHALADPAAYGLALRHAEDTGVYTPFSEKMYLYELTGP